LSYIPRTSRGAITAAKSRKSYFSNAPRTTDDNAESWTRETQAGGVGADLPGPPTIAPLPRWSQMTRPPAIVTSSRLNKLDGLPERCYDGPIRNGKDAEPFAIGSFNPQPAGAGEWIVHTVAHLRLPETAEILSGYCRQG
jgi:hypothetical protein